MYVWNVLDSQQCLWYTKVKKAFVPIIGILLKFNNFSVTSKKSLQRNLSHIWERQGEYLDLDSVKVSRKL